MNDIDILAALEGIDPDWREHFWEAEQAADFYREYSPAEWANAVRETQS